MRLITLFTIFLSSVFLQAEDFINQFEYGQMLYRNPRGIGCDKCHGPTGDGSVLGQYEKKGRVIQIIAPKISTMDLSRMKQGLSKRNKFMPSYQLTDEEIMTLVYYLHQLKAQK